MEVLPAGYGLVGLMRPGTDHAMVGIVLTRQEFASSVRDGIFEHIASALPAISSTSTSSGHPGSPLPP
jgi:hypothetical protein